MNSFTELKKATQPIKVVRVKYLRDIPRIQIIEQGDWIDLFCGEDTMIEHNEYKLIPLGVAIELPAGYEAIVAPRSSLFKRYGIIQVNSIGIIDESYKGDGDEWHFPAYNLGGTTIIPKGTRICQFRIVKHQPQIEIKECETLGNKNRGGIGSTGE